MPINLFHYDSFLISEPQFVYLEFLKKHSKIIKNPQKSPPLYQYFPLLPRFASPLHITFMAISNGVPTQQRKKISKGCTHHRQKQRWGRLLQLSPSSSFVKKLIRVSSLTQFAIGIAFYLLHGMHINSRFGSPKKSRRSHSPHRRHSHRP